MAGDIGSGLTLASRGVSSGFRGGTPKVPLSRSEELESLVQRNLRSSTDRGEIGVLIRHNAKGWLHTAQNNLRQSTGTEPDWEEIQELALELAAKPPPMFSHGRPRG